MTTREQKGGKELLRVAAKCTRYLNPTPPPSSLSLADPAVIAREFRDVAASARFLLPVVSVIRSRAREPPYVIRDKRIRETEAHPSRHNR